jgi:hypothetical protein
MGWNSIVTRISHYFARRPASALAMPTRARPAARPARAVGGFFGAETFAGHLSRLTLDQPGRDERLHVFSLSDFKMAAGAKWDKLGNLVEIATESIIRRHTKSEADIFTRLDAEISCLALPGASRPAARATVAAIAKDLTAHLFGDTLVGGRRPQVVAANLSYAEALTEDGFLDRDAIERALAEAGAAIAAQSDGAKPERQSVAALMGEPSPKAKLAMAVFAISGNSGPRTVEMPAWAREQAKTRKAAGPDPMADWLDGEFDRQAAEQVLNLGRDKTGLPPDANLTLLWTPTWVTAGRAVGAFQARMVRSTPATPEPVEGPAAYGGLNPVEMLIQDRFVATQASRELMNSFFGKDRVGLIIPFHWMSLAPRWRDCVRIPFEDCAAAARRRLLKVEVFGLGETMAPQVLANLFEPLEKLGCDVLARLPLSAMDLIGRLRGVRAVGTDLSELPEKDRAGDEVLFQRLTAFRHEARKAGLASYVWGVRRRPLIARLAAGGFSLINGPGVMCDLGRPILPTAKRKAA